MLADQMRTLFEFNAWAWNHVLKSVNNLDNAAESIWLSRCLGQSPTALFNPDAYNDSTAVQQHWAAVRDDWTHFLRGLTDKDMSRLIAYQNTRGDSYSLKLVDILQHVVNHATEHRSQMTPILSQLGVPTPPLDYMRFRLQP